MCVCVCQHFLLYSIGELTSTVYKHVQWCTMVKIGVTRSESRASIMDLPHHILYLSLPQYLSLYHAARILRHTLLCAFIAPCEANKIIYNAMMLHFVLGLIAVKDSAHRFDWISSYRMPIFMDILYMRVWPAYNVCPVYWKQFLISQWCSENQKHHQ